MANITGTQGNDTLPGTFDADTLMGGQGDDVIFGYRGDDLLFGNQGRDTLYGGQGQDTVFGGQDNDWITGDLGNDILLGNLGRDLLLGNTGDDTLFGGQGDDTLYGGQGNDLLYGDLGDDFVSGDLGDDTIVAGQGADTFVGGAGVDTIVLVQNRADYSIVRLENGDFLLVGAQGSVRVGSTENFAFADGTVAAENLVSASPGPGPTPPPAPTPPVYTIAASGDVVEGTPPGAGNTVTYTVTRAGDVSQTGSVAVSLGGTATNGSDYVTSLQNGTVNFAAGAGTAIFTVTSTPDTVVEPNETVVATLGAVTGGGSLGASTSATATISNDDTAPVYTIAAAPTQVAEGNTGPGNAITYTVTRTGDVSLAGSVAVALGGTATADDYVSSLNGGRLAFTAGSSTATFTVTTTPDTVVEADETVTATISDAQGQAGASASGTATATISNDDTAPVYTIAAAPTQVAEGNTGPGNAITYTVTRTGDVSLAGSVAVGLGGTATSDDYVAAGLNGGRLAFTAGSSTATFTVTTTPDTVVEADETVTATISDAQGQAGASASGTATATISNDDTAPVYTIAAAPTSVVEGTGSLGGIIMYRVSRTGDASQAGSVAVTLGGTATADDYIVGGLTGGRLTFAAGATSASFAVTSRADSVVEADETVTATISDAQGQAGASASGTATATIINDDTAPVYTIAPVDAVLEGNSGTGNTITYTVNRTGDVSFAGSVAVALGGTATADDYTVGGLAGGRLIFAAGATSATFTVTTIPDTVVEANETVTATISDAQGQAGATASGTASARIFNDDTAPVYTIAAAPTQVAEGNSGTGNAITYTVTRTGDISLAGSVAVALGGTATADDYVAAGLNGGRLAFTAGSSTASFTVTTTPDTVVEADETVTATISDAQGQAGASASGTATATITNDDTAPVTSRVSVGAGGGEANNVSFGPSISADGRYVSYTSAASNLVSGDTNGTSDVFVYDRTTQTTQRISVGVGGAEANGESFNSSISADGRYVSYISAASNLVSGDTNGTYDVFVYDRTTQTTQRVNIGFGGVEANNSSFNPRISADGTCISYTSYATNLINNDTNGYGDIFTSSNV